LLPANTFDTNLAFDTTIVFPSGVTAATTETPTKRFSNNPAGGVNNMLTIILFYDYTVVEGITIGGFTAVPKNGDSAAYPTGVTVTNGGPALVKVPPDSDWYYGNYTLGAGTADWPNADDSFKAGVAFKLKLVYTATAPAKFDDALAGSFTATNVTTKYTNIPTPFKSFVATVAPAKDKLTVEVTYVPTISGIAFTGLDATLSTSVNPKGFVDGISAKDLSNSITLTISEKKLVSDAAPTVNLATSVANFTSAGAPYTLTFDIVLPVGDNNFDTSMSGHTGLGTGGGAATVAPDGTTPMKKVTVTRPIPTIP